MFWSVFGVLILNLKLDVFVMYTFRDSRNSHFVHSRLNFMHVGHWWHCDVVRMKKAK